MEKILQFLKDYIYPIIGVIIAIVIIATGLYEVIVPIALIVLGIIGGLYFKKNKESIKEKIKSWIDKL